MEQPLFGLGVRPELGLNCVDTAMIAEATGPTASRAGPTCPVKLSAPFTTASASSAVAPLSGLWAVVYLWSVPWVD